MSLESQAQELFVIEPETIGNVVTIPENNPPLPEDAVYIKEEDFEPELGMPLLDMMEDVADTIGANEIMIVIDDLPGAPKGTEVPDIEVSEESENSENDKEDKDKSDKEDEDKAADGPKDSWDWSYSTPQEFMAWVQNRVNNVPNHSGYDTAGIERAIAYLERLDTEIGRAMRLDLDGKLDANEIESVRGQLENGLDKLYERRDKIRDAKRRNKKKKADLDSEITKEGQKITGVNGIMVTVPLLISRLARVCINSVVSAGKNLENVFDEQCKKYDLSEREKAELQQLLDDMGYPMFYDRGHTTSETYSPKDINNYDWNQNFPG